MKYLHDRDILFRDLHLGNVLIRNTDSERPDVVLCDFGAGSKKFFACVTPL